jgi:hypothetical protein
MAVLTSAPVSAAHSCVCFAAALSARSALTNALPSADGTVLRKTIPRGPVVSNVTSISSSLGLWVSCHSAR